MHSLPEIDKPSVLISLLNWNAADITLACLNSLLVLHCETGSVQILLIDNGSSLEDFDKLKKQIDPTKFILHREPNNLGPAAGHNIGIRYAKENGFDFVWLMNNDTLVQSGTLSPLLDEMLQHPECGAVSPLLSKLYDKDEMEFSGGTRDWKTRTNRYIESAEELKSLQKAAPKDIWVPGTAVLLRIAALNQVGLLDEGLFGYYEDTDLCARLANAGWLCRVCFSSTMQHGLVRDNFAGRPPYYFYLMQRNYLYFWHKNTPSPYRNFLWLRLLNQALFDVNCLYRRGFKAQADASLLGVHDFVFSIRGEPDLERRPPLLTRMIRRISALQQRKTITIRTATPL